MSALSRLTATGNRAGRHNGGKHMRVGPDRQVRKMRVAVVVAVLTLVCVVLLSIGLLGGFGATRAQSAAPHGAAMTGVASCAGSTCHGRMVADGKVVRQDELARWQEPSSPGGAHSRAFAVLSTPRSRQIAATLGLGDPTAAPACLGCHATPGAALKSDGVGCEACHGAAGGYIASHYAVGASHKDNVAHGLIPLDRPVARAGVCLDCHYGSAKPGQFVTHRIMAAGHPRISFELDLFSALQAHHDEDADYAARKGRSDGVRMWATGQAMALERALSLYAGPRGAEGAFPEFTFFDCHSCHRRIYDSGDRVKTWVANPARPIPAGMPPFNDENMILLSAAAKVAAPALAGQFDAQSKAFHAALATDRTSAVAAANRLRHSAAALASTFAGGRANSGLAFAIVDQIDSGMTAPRFTDYTGSAQAVMAVDTLLNALVTSGRVTHGAAAGIRVHINVAYAAVRDPNDFRPDAFRTALGAATRAILALR